MVKSWSIMKHVGDTIKHGEVFMKSMRHAKLKYMSDSHEILSKRRKFPSADAA